MYSTHRLATFSTLCLSPAILHQRLDCMTFGLQLYRVAVRNLFSHLCSTRVFETSKFSPRGLPSPSSTIHMEFFYVRFLSTIGPVTTTPNSGHPVLEAISGRVALSSRRPSRPAKYCVHKVHHNSITFLPPASRCHTRTAFLSSHTLIVDR